MNKNKGQALVEFIIILPILLLILLGMIDFGNIIYKRYKLESNLDVVVDLYEDNRSAELERYLLEEEIDVDYKIEGKIIKITLYKDVDIITPGLSLVLDNPYTISVERAVYYE